MGLLLLSSCGDSAWIEPPAIGPKSTQIDVGVYRAEMSVYSGSYPAMAPLAAVPRRKPTHQTAALPPERPFVADPQRLLGLSFESTKALLGDPALRVEEPPAKIWAYNGGICRLNVYFYPRVEDESFSVLAYEVTDGTSPTAAAELAAEPEQAAPEAEAEAAEPDGKNARRCLAVLLASRDSPEAR